ncbi:hypothetical protein [Sphingomonas sp. CFBP 13706]|uniref:hypothetical protein n=1 Tax=Sphingomonas sp. CFBP 13706 TaxID=2775314 RepID=UPI00178096CE|nr:hypothetical protein [Sphingomonas sp. CFBP 13706]MBD8734895.1 hypothetical protein [Sphingomonas sp. CFBP 13706]
MNALDQITQLVSERGNKIDRDDLNTIMTLAVDIPLEDSDYLGSVFEGIMLTVSDPLYVGNLTVEDLERV